jgi:NhaP-type Na+/H+ or K+/H+ antiporter
MTILLVFSVALVIAVLVSEWTQRSVLSTSLLFLVAGLASGPLGFGWIALDPRAPLASRVIEFTLFLTLFSDGMKLALSELPGIWRLSGRALIFGMPLSLVGTAVLAHAFAGLDWPDAWLIGAVLAPTDPVFAAALLGRQEVPKRLRRLLNVESGLNDGLALPLVLLLLASAGGRAFDPTTIGGELMLGFALGVAIPWSVLRLEASRMFAAGIVYRPLLAFSIALVLHAITSASRANSFLAAFTAGIVVASTSDRVRDDFHRFGESITELAKLMALLLFGALVTPTSIADVGFGAWMFAVAVLVLVRPIAVGISLLGSRLDRREAVAAAWFGPKGFASVVYSLLVLKSDIRGGEHLFHVAAMVIALSITVHSTSDIWVARWFRSAEPEPSGQSASERGRPETPGTGSAHDR